MRTTALQSRRRSAFTLIEILVVVAIIAILAALTAGAYFRIVGSQQLKRSEATVKKVQGGFDKQWAAVIDDAKEDIKNHKVNIAAFSRPPGGSNPAVPLPGVTDRDTANELYTLMKLKIEFPQTFAEARNPGLAAFGLQPKTVYVNELAGATATGAPEESAVLLYLSLSQTRRGVTFSADEIGGAVKVIQLPKVGGGTLDFKVIADAWGIPITFERFTTDAGWAAELTQLTNGNPQDPYLKLRNMPGGLRSYFSNLLVSSTNPYTLMFDGQYHGPIIQSAGPDKNFAQTNDNILGFRLMKEGQRGN